MPGSAMQLLVVSVRQAVRRARGARMWRSSPVCSGALDVSEPDAPAHWTGKRVARLGREPPSLSARWDLVVLCYWDQQRVRLIQTHLRLRPVDQQWIQVAQRERHRIGQRRRLDLELLEIQPANDIEDIRRDGLVVFRNRHTKLL